MNFKELQQRAKELGLRYVGVSTEDLKENIRQAENSSDESQEKTPKSPEDSPDAVVYQGKHKFRVYTLEQHGKDYVKLAEQFVSHPEREDFRVELETVENRIACPHCGKKFRHS